MSLTLICRQRRRFDQIRLRRLKLPAVVILCGISFVDHSLTLCCASIRPTLQVQVAAIPRTTAFTHRQITADQAQDDVGADEDARAADSGAAVHRDGTSAVHRPHVADEADQLVGAVRHAVIGPVRELQVMDQMSLTRL